jgi:predicted transcriptional regulator
MRRPRRLPRPVEDRPLAAQELRGARNAVGITQRDLASLAGLNQDQVAKYESGLLRLTDERFAYLIRVLAQVAS